MQVECMWSSPAPVPTTEAIRLLEADNSAMAADKVEVRRNHGGEGGGGGRLRGAALRRLDKVLATVSAEVAARGEESRHAGEVRLTMEWPTEESLVTVAGARLHALLLYQEDQAAIKSSMSSSSIVVARELPHVDQLHRGVREGLQVRRDLVAELGTLQRTNTSLRARLLQAAAKQLSRSTAVTDTGSNSSRRAAVLIASGSSSRAANRPLTPQVIPCTGQFTRAGNPVPSIPTREQHVEADQSMNPEEEEEDRSRFGRVTDLDPYPMTVLMLSGDGGDGAGGTAVC